MGVRTPYPGADSWLDVPAVQSPPTLLWSHLFHREEEEERYLADHHGEEMKPLLLKRHGPPWLDCNTHTLVIYESLVCVCSWGGGVSGRILPFLEPLPLLAVWSCCTASLRDGFYSAHFLSPSCLCSILSPPAQADTHSWMVQQTLACCWERCVSLGLRLR